MLWAMCFFQLQCLYIDFNIFGMTSVFIYMPISIVPCRPLWHWIYLIFRELVKKCTPWFFKKCFSQRQKCKGPWEMADKVLNLWLVFMKYYLVENKDFLGFIVENLNIFFTRCVSNLLCYINFYFYKVTWSVFLFWVHVNPQPH